MAKKHYPTGLDNRMRDHDGEIRKKRSDTKVETLRQTYGPEFAKGYRGDALLGNVLKREGVETLQMVCKPCTRCGICSHTALCCFLCPIASIVP